MYFFFQAGRCIVDLENSEAVVSKVYLLENEPGSDWRIASPFLYRNRYLVGFSSTKITLFELGESSLLNSILPKHPISQIAAVAFANGYLYIGGSNWVAKNEHAELEEESQYVGPALCRIQLGVVDAQWDSLVLLAPSATRYGKAVDCFAISPDEMELVAVDNTVHPNVDFYFRTDSNLCDAPIVCEARYLHAHNQSSCAKYTGHNLYAVMSHGLAGYESVQSVSQFPVPVADPDETNNNDADYLQVWESVWVNESNFDKHLHWVDFEFDGSKLFTITESAYFIGKCFIDSEQHVAYIPIGSVFNKSLRREIEPKKDAADIARDNAGPLSVQQAEAIAALRIKYKDELAKHEFYNFNIEANKVRGQINAYTTLGENGLTNVADFSFMPRKWVGDTQLHFLPRTNLDEDLRILYSDALGICIASLSGNNVT
jgi:hypothetical protein